MFCTESIWSSPPTISVGGELQIDSIQNVITLQSDLHIGWDDYAFGVRRSTLKCTGTDTRLANICRKGKVLDREEQGYSWSVDMWVDGRVSE